MPYAEQITHLRALRLPYSTAATRATSWRQFQAAYNLGPALEVDGIPGPLTTAAVRLSASKGYRPSAHFALSELDCPHCHRWLVTRAGLELLERIRARRSPGGLGIRSAFRCRVYNATVPNSSPTSAHVTGLAWDIIFHNAAGAVINRPASQLVGLGCRGIEERLNPRRVTHVDLKPSHPIDFIFHP